MTPPGIPSTLLRVNFSSRGYHVRQTPLIMILPKCDPTVPRVEPLLDCVIKTHYKLQELEIQEIDGKTFLDKV